MVRRELAESGATTCRVRSIRGALLGIKGLERAIRTDCDFAQEFWGVCVSMSLANSKKTQPLHTGYEFAGVVARARRGGNSGRAGRRTALLGMLTAAYANSTRGARSAEGRGSNGDRA